NGSDYRISHGTTLGSSGTGGRNLNWEIPYLPVGDVAVLIFNATNNYAAWQAPSPFNTNNTAEIISSSTENTGSNTVSTNSTVDNEPSNLEISIDPISPPTYIGNEVTFNIHVQRVGGNNANNVQVMEKLPLGYSITGTPIASSGTYDVSTGIWNIGNIQNDVDRTLTITAIAQAPTGEPNEYKNVASIIGNYADTDI